MMELIYGGIIYAVAVAEVYLVQYLDAPAWKINLKVKIFIPACSVFNGVAIAQIVKIRCMLDREAVLLAVFAGCLLFACLTDVKTCYVYQFAWWVAGAAECVLLWSRLENDFKNCTFETDFSNLWGAELRMADRMIPLLIFIMLQELFFCRFYGRADCHAFAVCSVVLCALGMGIMEYLTHMLLAFAGLAVVQAFRSNVNHKGHLKQPVAFLPYIALSFWVLIFF